MTTNKPKTKAKIKKPAPPAFAAFKANQPFAKFNMKSATFVKPRSGRRGDR